MKRPTKRPPTPEPRPVPSVLLTLDPASHNVGYALFTAGTLHRFGVLTATASWEPTRRIDTLTYQVECLVRGHKPDAVVMEWSEGFTAGRLQGRARGLAIMGQAQGAIRERLKACGAEPVAIHENTWTSGRKKATRAKTICMLYPEYARWAKDHDKGADSADAIGLALWWLGSACRAKGA